MKLSLLFKNLKSQLLLISFLCITGFSHAQYTLTDVDVVVTSGVITDCDYDFSQTDIVIPSTLDGQTVTGIGNRVFRSEGITSIGLPSTLDSIASDAFEFNSIDKLDLSNLTSLKYIGEEAFYYSSIDTLYLNGCSSLREIHEHAFYNNSMDTISLAGCTNLENIGYQAFYSNNLNYLDLSTCNSLNKIGHGAFQFNSIDEIDLSNCNQLNNIGKVAFQYNDLSSFVLPENSNPGFISWKDTDGTDFSDGDEVYNLDYGYNAAFAYTLTDSDVEVIDGVIVSCNYSFDANMITIPEVLDGQTVTGIGERVFYEKGIISVNLPTSIDSIADYAFYNNELYKLDLTNYTSLKFVGNSAFYSNPIDTLYLSGCSALKVLGNSCFSSNNNLDSLSLQGCSDLITIGNNCFYNSNIDVLDLSSCTSLVQIGNSAFSYNSLYDIDLSNCNVLREIGTNAFYSNSFSTFLLPENTETGMIGWQDTQGNKYENSDEVTTQNAYTATFAYTLTDGDVEVVDGIIISCGYDFDANLITIPSVLDGQTITGIGAEVFRDKGIISVSLPTTIESIANYAFRDNEINKLDFSGFTNLSYIGNRAFSDNNIGSLFFTGCGALNYIGDYSFRNNQTDTISFSGCSNLQTIAQRAFYECNFDYVDFSSCTSLENIGTWAFYSNSLDTIDITPCTSLRSIGSYAFYGNGQSSFILPVNSDPGFLSWVASSGDEYNGGDKANIFSQSYNATFSYTLTDADVVVEDGVITSCSYSFEANVITVPSVLDGQTITGIGARVFRSKGIISINLPTTLDSIASSAFYNNRIKKLDLSGYSNLSYIGNTAFYSNNIDTLYFTGCSSLEYIGYGSFQYNGTDSVSFNGCNNLSFIGSEAFRNCNLDFVDLSSCTSLETIEKSSFYSNSLDTIDLTACTLLRTIGSSAFGANNFSSFVLPNNSSAGFISWVTSDGSNLTGGATTINLSDSYYATFAYTLTDSDVVVENGVIISCSYSFDANIITVPTVLDGQTITGLGEEVFREKGILSISLPTTLVSLASSALSYNLINELDFSGFENLTYIGSNAFRGNSIDTLYFTGCSSLEYLGHSSFEGNSIDSISFKGCTNLLIIDGSAFYLSSFDSVNLTNCSSLKQIGYYAFRSNNLSSFILPVNTDPSFIAWIGSNGNLYDGGDEATDLNAQYNALFTYTLTDDDVIVEDSVIVSCSYNFENSSINVPSILDGQPVIGIGPEVFENEDIQSINLPSTLQFIGDEAFRNCDLISLNLNGYTELVSIGYSAFEDNNFNLVDLGNCSSLKNIGSNAFISSSIDSLNLNGCTSLRWIREYAFSNNNLKSVDLSSLVNLYHIGENAFYRFDGTNLSSLTLPVNPSTGFENWLSSDGNEYSNGAVINNLEVSYNAIVTYTLQDSDVVVEEGVIISCSYDFKENKIIIPTELDNQTVIGIADSVFISKGIVAVDLPITIQNIGSYAFQENYLMALDLTNYSSLSHIGPYAFRNNEINKVNLSNCSSLKYIGTSSFRDNKIDSLIVSGCNSLEIIHRYAFYNNNILNLDLSNNPSLRMIDGFSFQNNDFNKVDLSNCTALTEIRQGAFYSGSIDTLLINGCSSLTEIGRQAFFYNSIRKLDLTGCAALQTINEYAFYNNAIDFINFTGCSSLEYIRPYAFGNNSLNGVDLSELTALRLIGFRAFENNSISGFELPMPVREGFLFWQDGSGNNYASGTVVNSLTTSYQALFTHTLTDDEVTVVHGMITSCTYSFEDNYIIIPDELDGQIITGIDKYVFRYKNIKGITLPTTLKSIDEKSFANCGLTSLDLSGHDNLELIGISAFSDNNFAKVDLSNCKKLRSIGYNAFRSSNMDTLYLNGCAGLKSIGNNAFSYNSLDTISLEGNTALKRIYNLAFYNNQLDTIDLSSCTGLLRIDESAFRNNGITSFSLPTPTIANFIEWRDNNSVSYESGDIVDDFYASYKVVAAYTLTDDDVEVQDGVIISCSYNFDANVITIPDVLDGQTITGIGNTVFQNNGIVSVTLPSLLETIAYRSFYSNELEEINWNGNNSLISIGSQAFRNNKIKIVDLRGMTDLSRIDQQAFYSGSIDTVLISGCEKLREINLNAFASNSIDTLSFVGCSSLRIIGDNAFYSNSIDTVDLSSCDSLTSIGESAFASNSMSAFRLPAPIIPNFIAWQDDNGNNYNPGDKPNDLNSSYQALSPYTLTDNDVVVENGIIVSCSYDFVANLITIPDTLDEQKIIGTGNAVFKKKNIKGIILPESIETIGYNSFANNKILNLDLNGYSYLRSIDDYAFNTNEFNKVDLGNCTALQEIGTRAFEGSSIDTLVLKGCSSLKTIEMYSFRMNSLLDLDFGGCTELESINSTAFSDNNISKISFEGCNSLTLIGNTAFSYNSIDTLDLSSCINLEVIEYAAFRNNGLDSVNISSNMSLTRISSYAFNSSNVDGIQLPAINSEDFVGWRDIDEGYIHPDSLFIYDFTNDYVAVRSHIITNEDVTFKDGVIVNSIIDLYGKAIIIPEKLNGQTIIGIGKSAFEEMGIMELDLSQCSGLIFIDNSAFHDNFCSNLDFSDCPSLEKIGNNAFQRNKISSINLSDNDKLVNIGSYSFNRNLLDTVDITGCTALSRLGSYAFEYNEINSLVLPEPDFEGFIEWESNYGDGGTYPGGDTVYNLYSYYLANSIYTLKDHDVVVYEGVIISCNYNFQATKIIIPSVLDGQTIIGIADANEPENGVFAEKEIYSVQLPESLQFIGDYAFYSNNLDTLDLTQNTELQRIGKYAFASNRALHELTFSNNSSLKLIESFAFNYCEFTKLDLSNCSLLESIESSAFERNYIDTLNFESCSSLSVIGENAFRSNSIKILDLSSCASLDFIGRLAFNNNQISKIDFRGCDELSYIAPAAFNQNRVDTVNNRPSNGLIFGRTAEGSVDSSIVVSYGGPVKDIDFLTPGIKKIGEYAFQSSNINSIDFTNCPLLENIGVRAFDNSNIHEIDFSSNNNLKSVDDYAFYSNEIRSLSFENCNNLEDLGKSSFLANNIDTVDLLNKTKLTIIGDYAFSQNSINSLNIEGCTSLNTIGAGAFSRNAIDTLDLSSNSSLIAIGQSAFYNNDISKLTIATDAKLMRIGNQAFYSNNLDTVDISSCEELINIGEGAFANNNFSGMVLPSPSVAGFEYWINDKDSVIAGGDKVDNLFSYYLAKLPAYTLTDNDVEVIDGVIIKAAHSFKGNEIIVPEVLDGQTIIGISDEYQYKGVFAYRGLLSVVLPSNLEYIGLEAFYKNQLRMLDLSKTEKLTKIGRHAFSQNKLKSISFDSCLLLKIIEGSSFYGNSIDSLNLNMLENLESIGSGAFHSNELDTVMIDKCSSLTYLGWGVFDNNPEIGGFILPTPGGKAIVLDYWYDGDNQKYAGGAWTENLILEYFAHMEHITYAVYFNIIANDMPLAGATIDLYQNGSQVTNENGIAGFLNVLPDSNIIYSATAPGYSVETGLINVTDSDVTVNLQLNTVWYTVTFTVTIDLDPVEGATVELGNLDPELTNTSGIAVFNAVAPQNGISYTVSLYGYDDITGSLDVIDANVPVSVNFADIISTDNFAEESNYRIYPNPVSDVLYIEGFMNEKVYLYKLSGELVFEKDLLVSKNTLDFSGLYQGLYYLHIADKVFMVSVIR